MAYACRNSGVPYDVQWTQAENGTIAATVTATGDIPMPKALPKPPKAKPVSDWQSKYLRR
jgi:hypothetical protein